MEVNQQQVYEALGVEQAAPSSQESPLEQPTVEPNQAGESVPQPSQGEMSLEQRRENAARRRREETRAAIHQAVEQERIQSRQTVEEVLQSAGLTHPADGSPITNLEEYQAWKKAQQPSKVAAVPRQEVTPAQVEAELAQIRQLNPNIRTIQDLLTMPKAQQFYQLVQRGNSFVDAYKLAHYDQLTQQAAAAARQQAQTLARSKGHLIAATQRGKGAVTVPSQEMELFRAFNPQASEAAIQAYYNQYQGCK